jgi:hypothetical protein
MWQRIRECWLPLLLFSSALLMAFTLLTLVIASPLANDYLPESQFIHLFADDATVRRSSIAGAIGLVVTAFVFFRPNLSAGRKAPKATKDTIAGA